MSDEKTYTEREKVLAERAAYQHGVYDLHFEPEIPGGPETGAARDRLLGRIREEYPLPKVTRHRVMPDPNEPAYEWSVRDGDLHFRWLKTSENNWKRASGLYENMLLTPTHARVAMWADLLAHPTEQVEAE